MTETAILQRIRLACSRGAVRLFRNNQAKAWVGEIIARSATTITLRNPRILHAGLMPGSGDLIGWRTVTVTPEMIGTQLAVFVSVEVKSARGYAKEHQRNWAAAVIAAGGIAGLARDEAEAEELINRHRHAPRRPGITEP